MASSGTVDVYSSESSNNGIVGQTDLEADYLVSENNPFYIVFGDHTRSMNLASRNFSVMDNVRVLSPKFKTMKDALFICSAWKKTIPNLGYSRHWSVAKNSIFQLPVTTNGEIDFDFMETFIFELEKERIHKLEAYLKTSGFSDYNLTEEEKEALKLFDSTLWREFRIGDLFKSSNGDFDIQKKHINGRGDYVVSAGLTNNGIIGKSDVEASVFERETITIDMFGNAFYRQFPYKMVTHARVFSLSPNFDITDRVGLYLACALHFLPNLFGYENMCSWEKIKDKKIPLPLTLSGEIDFDFMELFIRAVQKTVIKNVVLFTDEKIKATKRIVNAP